MADILLVPSQLANRRFVLLNKWDTKGPNGMELGKVPIEADWQNSANYPADDPRFERHVTVEGKNYGVLCTDTEVVIDEDDHIVGELVTRHLPLTFTVLTGTGKRHFYYKVSTGAAKAVRLKMDGQDVGEIRARGNQVVGPGSMHPNGNLYKVLEDRPIANVSESDLMGALAPLLARRVTTIGAIERGVREGERNNSAFNYARFLLHHKRLNMEAAWRELEDVNRKFSPPLGEDELRRTLESAQGYPWIETAGPKAYIAELGEKSFGPFITTHETPSGSMRSEIDLQAVLDYLKTKYFFKTPMDTEAVHIYKDGIYVNGEGIVKAELEGILGKHATRHLVEEVLGHLERSSYVERSEFNKPGSLIPVENGLLNLETRALERFSKDRIFTFKIKARYDGSASCPKFSKFLEEVLPDEKKKLAVLEIMGYTLVPAMPYHKVFFFVGSGRNGKGVTLRTLASILGSENTSQVPIGLVGYRFKAANLYGKLLNVSSEPTIKDILNTEVLKSLSGEDWIDGELKGIQDPIKFLNFAKFIVMANALPKVNDNSLGWWDRVIVIEFTEEFIDEKAIPNIVGRWLNDEEERSGILNLMLDGLQRLTTNNKFTKSDVMKAAEEEYRRYSNPVACFFADRTEIVINAYTSKAALYENYQIYCQEQGFEILSDRKFNELVKQLPRVRSDDQKIKGITQKVWRNINIKVAGVAGVADTTTGKGTELINYKVEGGCRDSNSGNPSNRIEDFLSKEICFNCVAWNGSDNTSMALCGEHHRSTPKDGTCEKFYRRQREAKG